MSSVTIDKVDELMKLHKEYNPYTDRDIKVIKKNRSLVFNNNNLRMGTPIGYMYK